MAWARSLRPADAAGMRNKRRGAVQRQIPSNSNITGITGHIVAPADQGTSRSSLHCGFWREYICAGWTTMNDNPLLWIVHVANMPRNKPATIVAVTHANRRASLSPCGLAVSYLR